MKINSAYRTYTPAIATLAGALLLSIGLFGDQFYPSLMFRWVQFLGALAAAGGAFWSGHRQIIRAEDDQIRNKKVIEMSEQLRGHATGGDSFCYGHPAFFEGGHFHWLIIHEGEFPLTDVSVRIHNLERVDGPINVGRTIELGTIFPGRAHTVGEFAEI